MPAQVKENKRRNKTPDHILAQKREYYRANREARLAYQREYEEKTLRTSLVHTLRRILSNAKTRARLKNLDCDLTNEWVLERVRANDWRCEKTGISFTCSKRTRNPWKPSIDRIDSSQGYTTDNVQIVCMVYNNAKNTFTDDEIRHFAQELVNNTR